MKRLSYAPARSAATTAVALFLAAACSWIGRPAAAQWAPDQDSPAAHLLRLVEMREVESGMAVDEVMIFRDGLTVATRTGPDGTREMLRSWADATSLAGLGEALSEHRVGHQTSGCRVPSLASAVPGGPVGNRRHTLISWFGRGPEGRARHLEVSPEAEVFSGECHPAMAQLARAAVDFSRRTLTAGAEAGVGVNSSLLLDLNSRMQADAGCGFYAFAERVLIFRDGVLLRQVEDNQSWYVFTRAQISDQAMQHLGEMLAEDRIGLQEGSCRLWFFLPFLVDEECAEFDWWSSAAWFGRRSRSSLLSGNHAETAECSPARSRLRRAILGTVLEALAGPEVTSVAGDFVLH